MTTTQTILWTALPRGRAGQRLLLSVYLSPRLVTNRGLPKPRLKEFPDFLHWGHKSGTVNFEAVFSDGAKPVGLRAARVSASADPVLWDAVFTEQTFVRPYRFDNYGDRIIRSFPHEGVRSFTQKLYGNVGQQSPTQPPPLSGDPATPLGRLITELGPVRDNPAEHGAVAMEADLVRDKVVRPGSLHGFATEAQLAFHQAARFYSRPENASAHGPINPEQAPPSPTPPEVDFHQMATRLADHPSLLRSFGLVFDLEVALPVGTVVPAEGTVQVRPVWSRDDPPVWQGNEGDPTQTDRSPRTRYLLTDTAFRAKSKDFSAGSPDEKDFSDLADGMLRLENSERFDVSALDVDGAALKVADFAQNMLRIVQAANSSYTKPDSATLPSLRSGGFTITRKDRADRLLAQLNDANANNTMLESGGDPELYADDLTRGYRIDVLDDKSKDWRSLCAQQGTYEFPGTAAPTLRITDEGYVKGASATSTPKADGKPDVYVHEAMFGWDGWGLCAPRPGRTIVPVPGPDGQQENVQPVTNTAALDFPFQANFRVPPGTLPRLRYGTRYRIRARAVDLAGNSEPLDSQDASHATAALPYLRFEPVAPPVLVLRAPITEGESLEHMVIRSNHDVSAADWINLPEVKRHRYLASNERHVAPPKTAQLMAETHGAFDDFLGSGKDYQRGFVLAVREEGTFLDTLLVDPRTGGPTVRVPGIELITPPGVRAAPGETLPSLPLTRGQALAPGQYVIHRAERIKLPYLPDVFARGVVFAGIPNPHEAFPLNLEVPFDGAWPDLSPFRVRIVEGDGPHSLDPAARVLTVPLPKGTMTKLRYSCFLRSGDPEQMGIFHWIAEPNTGLIRSGLHWMFTPSRELTLVHAVQQPLEIPEFDGLTITRAPGATAAGFAGFIECDSPSTGKVEVRAEWQESVDVVTKDAPGVAQKTAQVASFDVAYDDLGVRVAPVEPPATSTNPARRMVHEFGDTRYRRVDYYCVATTRYREYFAPALTKNPASITRSGQQATVDEPTGFGQRIRLDVLSSARPAAPKLEYVVPTFGWSQHSLSGGGLASVRSGSGLRVYLGRPWYSSGDGELLAVLLAELVASDPPGEPMEFRFIPEGLKPYITQWGDDPLWYPTGSKPRLFPEMFPRKTLVRTGLFLEELPGHPVIAIGHAVEYDPARKLWFCDIDLDEGTVDTYYPFIRLAIARFQPKSIDGAHLSRVVLTDFIQLAPSRVAELAFPRPQQLSITVRGVAGANSITYKDLNNSDAKVPLKENLDASRVMQVSIQRPVDPARLDDELGWQTIGPDTVLEATAANGQGVQWTGTVTLPAVPKRMGGQQNFRVLIREFERLRTDLDVSELIFTRGPVSNVPLRSRLAYADALVI